MGDLLWLTTTSGVLVLVLLGASSYPAAQPLLVAELGINATEAGFMLVILGYAAHSWELYVAWVWLAPSMTWVLAQSGLAPAEAAGLAAAAVGLGAPRLVSFGL